MLPYFLSLILIAYSVSVIACPKDILSIEVFPVVRSDRVVCAMPVALETAYMLMFDSVSSHSMRVVSAFISYSSFFLFS